MNSFPSSRFGLHSGFLSSAERYPDRPALDVAGRTYSYREVLRNALNVAASVDGNLPSGAPRRVGVLARRSLDAYTGLLGTMMAGAAVVPLNPGFPPERTRQMIDIAGLGGLIVDETSVSSLPDLLLSHRDPLLVLVPEEPQAATFPGLRPEHRIMSQRIERSQEFAARPVDSETLAYLFFTSGSTGVPKGVGVLHRNAARFVEMSLERYRADGITEQDRFSQFYDITFDSSMFDLYVGWAFGACVCVPSVAEWVNPNKYIESKALTVIDIVPSTGRAMNRGAAWRAGRFDGLRLCRFGGEALPADLAMALAAAAPNAVVDNVYGPTECTVDAAYFRWNSALSAGQCVHGIAPIGTPGPGVGLKVVDAQLQEVAVGAEGELLISGAQVTPGYWNDPAKTAASFVRLTPSNVVHYRTGDLVRRPPDGEPIPYLGRIDFQIKISGVRIELGEVEAALRSAADTDQAVAVGWPRTAGGATGIVAFVVKPGADVRDLRERLKAALPLVMVPKEIYLIDEMPLNVNGKVDRSALLQRLQSVSG